MTLFSLILRGRLSVPYPTREVLISIAWLKSLTAPRHRPGIIAARDGAATSCLPAHRVAGEHSFPERPVGPPGSAWFPRKWVGECTSKRPMSSTSRRGPRGWRPSGPSLVVRGAWCTRRVPVLVRTRYRYSCPALYRTVQYSVVEGNSQVFRQQLGNTVQLLLVVGEL
jgi:hypothetical protein